MKAKGEKIENKRRKIPREMENKGNEIQKILCEIEKRDSEIQKIFEELERKPKPDKTINLKSAVINF
jgi:SMC interacting uncharacterized protein involved in chromosome segregation